MTELDYHIGRVLLLLQAMTPRGGRLEGLTKLAKLDFLLRYPAFLERLMHVDGVGWPEGLEPTPSERLAVESRMIRYKYGPWDDRYYPVVGALVGMQLAETSVENGRYTLRLTRRGRQVARHLASDSRWATMAGRASLLREHYNFSGNALRERIYRELPDAVDVPMRTEI
jgi:hypothetical protein